MAEQTERAQNKTDYTERDRASVWYASCSREVHRLGSVVLYCVVSCRAVLHY